MRLSIALFCSLSFATTPAVAEDIFTYFEEGSWGIPRYPEASCETNPSKIRFSQDKSRATFFTELPITNFRREKIRQYGYDVLSYDQDGIVMAIDNEERLTPDGKLVVWVLKPLPGNDMFCWGRTDWPSTGCISIHIRCPELPPIS